MRRVAIIVTHLLGTGHLSRSITLARALADAGLAPQLISGGMPVRHLDLSRIDFVQLPPVRSDGTSFTSLLDSDGNPASHDLMQARGDALVATLRKGEPDALITELFPFGRRVLREEFLTALAATRSMTRPPLVLSSVRDILAPPSSEKKATQTERWLSEFYDGVLVHSDPNVAELDASWPVTPKVAELLRYTGFITPPPPVPSLLDTHGAGEIIVSAGGGSVGRKLFETAVAAARISRRHWRLLVGGADADAVCARLNALAKGASAVAEPVRADYRTMLTRCAAAIGQCGYNTAIDWLQAGVPGVFVPFAEAGEVEQTLRASLLRDRYGYGMIAEEELTPENLAAAAENAVRQGRFKADGLNFDGAAETGRILINMLDKRE
ncbi:glycosyltransferase [Mesorhizobium sp. VNQ89]|uniref:glycosyltransferase family protein n=1 Tax=Mesorhizobium quangtriensis TaxID=3157709 RepID=UPI0032B7CDCB